MLRYKRPFASFLAMLFLVTLAACAPVGPDYVRPNVEVPVKFVENGPWRKALPQDSVSRGDWWTIFNDSLLNDLEEQAVKNNPDLKAVAARVQQARAIAGISESYLYPEVNLGAVASRYAVSQNRPDQPPNIPNNVAYATDAMTAIPLYASYEIDFWGKLRRQVESSEAKVQASVASYQTALLTLNGEVAQTYFLIRITDELLRILNANIDLRRAARDLTKARRRDGLSSDLDLLFFETEVTSTQALAQSAEKRRIELTYKLAVLIGITPESFKLEPTPFKLITPAVPVDLPSDLLERRPDIAFAERNMAAYNAEIGIAISAYFPSFTFNTGFGFNSYSLNLLTDHNSWIWGLGTSVFMQLFNAGRLGFNVDRSRAAYQEQVALYQGVILKSFQEVESAIAGLRLLERQSAYQKLSVSSADRATMLATKRYQAGLVSMLDVITAQRASLEAETAAIQIANDQLMTSVMLIKALGGGWGK